ncbi:MAG TPA: nuclear transport factor 2 family protein [Candidatus Krumholzibacteria bacterium]|nr:nuclear transport factor 2 family protein [Candidatus Krumholzibacteria bacterium]
MIEPLELLYTRVWREHDLEGALADLPPDFEWLVPGFPGDEATRGREGTLEFFRDWIDQWGDLRVDWELEQGTPDTILAVVDMRGRGRVSGVPVELHFAQVWSFREDVPVRMVYYADIEEGRCAAGLASTPPGP